MPRMQLRAFQAEVCAAAMEQKDEAAILQGVRGEEGPRWHTIAMQPVRSLERRSEFSCVAAASKLHQYTGVRELRGETTLQSMRRNERGRGLPSERMEDGDPEASTTRRV